MDTRRGWMKSQGMHIPDRALCLQKRNMSLALCTEDRHQRQPQKCQSVCLDALVPVHCVEWLGQATNGQVATDCQSVKCHMVRTSTRHRSALNYVYHCSRTASCLHICRLQGQLCLCTSWIGDDHLDTRLLLEKACTIFKEDTAACANYTQACGLAK